MSCLLITLKFVFDQIYRSEKEQSFYNISFFIVTVKVFVKERKVIDYTFTMILSVVV